MGPSYLEEKQTSRGLKLDRVRSLISNREYKQKMQADSLPQTSTDFREKKPKSSETSLKELDKAKEFKMFQKQLLNVATFDPEIGHLLMIMDQICHSEASTIQVLKIKTE